MGIWKELEKGLKKAKREILKGGDKFLGHIDDFIEKITAKEKEVCNCPAPEPVTSPPGCDNTKSFTLAVTYHTIDTRDDGACAFLSPLHSALLEGITGKDNIEHVNNVLCKTAAEVKCVADICNNSQYEEL